MDAVWVCEEDLNRLGKDGDQIHNVTLFARDKGCPAGGDQSALVQLCRPPQPSAALPGKDVGLDLLHRIIACTHRPNPTDKSRIDVAPGMHRNFQRAIEDALVLVNSDDAAVALVSQPQPEGEVVLPAIDWLVSGAHVKVPGYPTPALATIIEPDRVYVAYPGKGMADWYPVDKVQPWGGYREALGRAVRIAWVEWASALSTNEAGGMNEPRKSLVHQHVDRCIESYGQIFDEDHKEPVSRESYEQIRSDLMILVGMISALAPEPLAEQSHG